jgi:hypothetical protein
MMERLQNPFLRMGLAVFLGAFASIMDIIFHLPGEAAYVFFYFFPVFVAFFLFVFDRLQYRKDYLWPQWGIDGIVVLLSVLRMFFEIPVISGHAYFLTFAFVTIRSLSSRVFLLLVWLQVMYLKIAVLHDATFLGGVIAGLVSAGIWYWIEKNIIGKQEY